MALSKREKKQIKDAGFRLTTPQELLGLSDAEVQLIELRYQLACKLRETRQEQQLTQAELAKLIRSTQPKIAKAEAGKSTTDFMLKSLLAMGLTSRRIGELLAAKPKRRGLKKTG